MLPSSSITPIVQRAFLAMALHSPNCVQPGSTPMSKPKQTFGRGTSICSHSKRGVDWHWHRSIGRAAIGGSQQSHPGPVERQFGRSSVAVATNVAPQTAVGMQLHCTSPPAAATVAAAHWHASRADAVLIGFWPAPPRAPSCRRRRSQRVHRDEHCKCVNVGVKLLCCLGGIAAAIARAVDGPGVIDMWLKWCTDTRLTTINVERAASEDNGPSKISQSILQSVSHSGCINWDCKSRSERVAGVLRYIENCGRQSPRLHDACYFS